MVRPSKFVDELTSYKITAQDVWSPSAPNDLMKLDWNEAPFDFRFYRDEIRRISSDRGVISWYPDYLAIELTDEIGKFCGADPNLVLTFPGSDVALETLCRAYLEPEDRVVTVCPTYENFFVFALQTGARLDKFGIEDLDRIDVERLGSYIADSLPTKMVYITRPNNPCGYITQTGDIIALVERFPDTLFVLDEAYIEFSDEISCISLVERYPNLAVTRTFSKAFGLAGMRLGYLVAAHDVVVNVNKIRNGKNISMISQRLGLFALRNFHYIKEWIEAVKSSRSILMDWCRDNGILYLNSHGNFVLLMGKRPESICSLLKSKGIYVRNRDSLIKGGIRISLGSQVDTLKLIHSLAEIREHI